jgi:hypothetical protein
VVEIYPRVLTGPVVKSDRAARETYLEKLDLRPSDRADARSDDNAFDALISALAMAEAAETFSGLLGEDPLDALEGRIWEPPTVSGAPGPASRQLETTHALGNGDGPAGKTGTFTLGSRRRSRNWAASPMSPRSRSFETSTSQLRPQPGLLLRR